MDFTKPQARRKVERRVRMTSDWMNDCIKEIDSRILVPIDISKYASDKKNDI